MPLFALVLIALLAAPMALAESAPRYDSLRDWGEALFFDTDLSASRTQSCASCHDPEHGLADPRGGAVSLGHDGVLKGTRNAPMAAYAGVSPRFGRDAEGNWTGGQFLDGRAADLAEQAMGPLVNPVEMALSGAEEVAARVLEDPRHAATLRALKGEAAARDPQAVYAAVAEAIAAYEAGPEFNSFDSKYDRFLRGEATLSDEEELGRVLFFSQQFTNCNMCHQLRPVQGAEKETFSDYSFHNIGVPANPDLAGNGVDRGLLENPAIDDPAQAGKFKVPSLRNVAVTGPYMHNGVFSDLRTVLLFYNSYNSKRPERQINPETGAPFGPPEVAENIALEELEHGPALKDQRIAALEAFLRTLTDARFEYLLEE